MWKGEVVTYYKVISDVFLDGLSKTTRDLGIPCLPAEVPIGYVLDTGKMR
jgi:hypothetical protein